MRGNGGSVCARGGELMTNTLLVLHADVSGLRTDYEREGLEIWVDPLRGQWCIGPPRYNQSVSKLLRQVDPAEFFIMAFGKDLA